jgi:hypothetical protein
LFLTHNRKKDTMVPCYFSLPHFKGAIASRVSQTPTSHTAHSRNSPKFWTAIKQNLKAKFHLYFSINRKYMLLIYEKTMFVWRKCTNIPIFVIFRAKYYSTHLDRNYCIYLLLLYYLFPGYYTTPSEQMSNKVVGEGIYTLWCIA